MGVHVPACSQVLHGPDALRTLAEVGDLVTRINRSKICIENPDSRFLAVLERRKGGKIRYMYMWLWCKCLYDYNYTCIRYVGLAFPSLQNVFFTVSVV